MALPSLRQQIEQLIASPSVSCTRADLDMSNRGVIELLEGWLSHLGFATEVMEVAPGKYNLIATLGSGPGGLVLAGHTDTVPCNEEKWQSNPFRVTERDQKLYGLGSCDMKGFFAVAIEALLPFLEQPGPAGFKEPLIILATADEECSMIGARALAESGRLKARKAVIGEPTSLRPIYQHKGIMMNGLRITGQAGHSSNPALGNSAMEAMHSVMTELMDFRQDIQSRYRNADFTVQVPTLNLGCIHGGDNPNRICGQCELEFDLRALPGMDNDELFAQMQQRLQPVAERHNVKFELYPLFPHIPAFSNQRELELIQTCERLTGHSAESVAFATEGPFLQKMGMETLILGPGSIDQAHQPDEFLALDQIEPAVRILRGLIKRYCLQTEA
ncbi:acetylornithine deacetylase [Pokkaliibacter plantistimulans]|uniref:Acetylornithine deacetylase n=1 Tax=Pokkaliibacter plantistimulans TaxID=1635171 RepID=A0ABX5M2G4_9GAMM|nr:acetylornithine deacetylase [Pokkaliibacter plantistimulans]PXF33109.1 acetylornithine deacetylase [Pokkaliibacter plantistimulans]